VEEYRCCLQSRTLTNQKTLMKHKIQHGKLLSSWSLISDQNGTTLLSQRSNNWSPDVYKLLLKEDEMLHRGKHGLVPILFRHVAAMNFMMSDYF